MHLYTLVSALALGAFVIYKFISLSARNAYHRRRAQELGCQEAPRLKPERIFGINNAKRFLNADRNKRFPDMVIERFAELSEQEGRNVVTTVFNIMGVDMFHTIDPVVIQSILATQFDDWVLGEARNDSFSPLLGKGIFATDGERWDHSRALLRPQFVRHQVGDLDLFETHVQHLLKAISFKDDGWSDVTDLSPLFFRLTLDTSTEFLFGESVLSQLAALPEHQHMRPAHGLDAEKFGRDFNRAQEILALFTRLGELYWLVPGKELAAVSKTCHDFVDYFVYSALRLRASGALDLEKDEKKYVFLHALVKETTDPLELRYQSLNILLAGRDTTASTICWIFQLLAQHPEVMKKLRATILENFGTYSNPRNLSFATLKNCSYLQHVISETLRLYPVISHNGRRARRDTTLPRGGGPDGLSPIYIRKDDEIAYTVHAMHRRKDLWGPDADSFRPERWDGRKPTHSFDFLPFNAGPRICLGQQLALIESSYVTVRLLQRIEEIDGFGSGCNVPRPGQPVRHGLTLVNCPADGVKVRMKSATDL